MDKEIQQYIKEVDINVGKRIHSARKTLGMTRKELAPKIGVTEQQLAKYENSANRISMGRLALVAKYLGQKMNYFCSSISIEHQTPCQLTERVSDDYVITLKILQKIAKIKNYEQKKALCTLVEGLL